MRNLSPSDVKCVLVARCQWSTPGSAGPTCRWMGEVLRLYLLSKNKNFDSTC